MGQVTNRRRNHIKLEGCGGVTKNLGKMVSAVPLPVCDRMEWTPLLYAGAWEPREVCGGLAG